MLEVTRASRESEVQGSEALRSRGLGLVAGCRRLGLCKYLDVLAQATLLESLGFHP